ncbi:MULTISPECIES: hydantoinase/oxoprolinase family protein [Ramlibacter]|uniref:Hydantoinase/oxoprolinase family protein n=1 Tax=Ramlibacter pinisoli TaxID=2682844 RepID=A0A6N8ISV7_9BURK|nr:MULTISPECIES: hydantoinase/oxoprolinase family protein [Ramlibacter]MBA2965036.1 hydantoinase/oxoprolinase family protein [Ramlibacter sp. CGMCC 1.13660]MVQ30001.1 hydantoinase/oxoprolinase family protein [Ramlibacter pinisoli]
MRIGSDIGGTFTDVVTATADGRFVVTKVPSTPPDFAAGLVNGVEQGIATAAGKAGDVQEVLHACTVATNAILEHRGARTGLLTTRGFRDVLELRRIRVPRLYDPQYERPEPLVPRELRFELDERMAGDGSVLVALTESEIQRAVTLCRDHKLEAVAVCFINSYRNPEHERRLGDALRSALPSVYVSLSVDVLPEMREYERTSTTVINSYVGPPVSKYLSTTRSTLQGRGIKAPLVLMQSSGGVATAQEIEKLPAQIIECGPAAGVVGAAKLAAAVGMTDVIAFDMGGTTAKASLIEKGRLFLSDNYEVGSEQSFGGVMAGGAGYALRLPVIDIAEVGAGGGSLVAIDKAGAIQVGPQSAGAIPGPACYGKGNVQPTVTDANVALGYIGALAGGSLPIDPLLARDAIQKTVVDRIGGTVEAAAHGIRQVANARMARAIKSVSTYKGRDPRACVLVCYGGNGGVHGPDLARLLQIKDVLIPPAAGVFSALGLLCADMEGIRMVPVNAGIASIEASQLRTMVDNGSRDLLASPQLAGGAVDASAMMRYEGQLFELAVRIPDGAYADLSLLTRAFENEHERTYGHRPHGNHPVEITSLRVAVHRPSQSPIGRALAALEPVSSTMPERRCYFGEEAGWVTTAVVSRGAVGRSPRPGPIIVQDVDGTTVVPPDATVWRDELNNLRITLQ